MKVKLYKEFINSESINEDYESDRIKKFTSQFKRFKLPPGYTIWLDSAYGAGSKVEVLRKDGKDEGVIISDPYSSQIQLHTTKSGDQIAKKSGYNNLDKAMADAVKYLNTVKESKVDEDNSKLIEEGFFHEQGTGKPIKNEAHLKKEIKEWFDDKRDFNMKEIIQMWKSGKYNISTIEDALDILSTYQSKGTL